MKRFLFVVLCVFCSVRGIAADANGKEEFPFSMGEENFFKLVLEVRLKSSLRDEKAEELGADATEEKINVLVEEELSSGSFSVQTPKGSYTRYPSGCWYSEQEENEAIQSEKWTADSSSGEVLETADGTRDLNEEEGETPKKCNIIEDIRRLAQKDDAPKTDEALNGLEWKPVSGEKENDFFFGNIRFAVLKSKPGSIHENALLIYDENKMSLFCFPREEKGKNISSWQEYFCSATELKTTDFSSHPTVDKVIGEAMGVVPLRMKMEDYPWEKFLFMQIAFSPFVENGLECFVDEDACEYYDLSEYALVPSPEGKGCKEEEFEKNIIAQIDKFVETEDAYINGFYEKEGMKNPFKGVKGTRNFRYAPACLNGYLVISGEFKDKTKGKALLTFYGDTGSLMSVNLKLPSGRSLEKLYFGNGQPAQEETFLNEKKDGPSFYYHTNGAKASSFFYKNGQPDGVFEKYFESGRLKAKGFYKDGLLQGPLTAYYENGNLKFNDVYIDGKLTGSSKSFDMQGNLFEEKYYRNGEEVPPPADEKEGF